MSNNLTEKLKCVWLRNIQPSPLAKCVTCAPTRGQVRSCKAGQFSSLGTKSAPVYEGAVPAGGNNDGNKRQTQFKEPESPPWQEVGDGGQVYSWDFQPVYQCLSRLWGEQPVVTNPWSSTKPHQVVYCHYYELLLVIRSWNETVLLSWAGRGQMRQWYNHL